MRTAVSARPAPTVSTSAPRGRSARWRPSPPQNYGRSTAATVLCPTEKSPPTAPSASASRSTWFGPPRAADHENLRNYDDSWIDWAGLRAFSIESRSITLSLSRVWSEDIIMRIKYIVPFALSEKGIEKRNALIPRALLAHDTQIDCVAVRNHPADGASYY